MDEYVLSFKPAIGGFGVHDPSLAIFRNGEILYTVEEERLNQQKHVVGDFPHRAIQACLEYPGIDLSDVERIILPYNPKLQTKITVQKIREAASWGNSNVEKGYEISESIERLAIARFYPTVEVEQQLRSHFDGPLPPIELRSHHACHAASAFHPSDFDQALVLTIDGRGEYDSTVVWKGAPDGLRRIRMFEFPNGLGYFYGILTEFLAYSVSNRE